MEFKIAKHPTLNLRIKFNEEKHRYYDTNGIRYCGVTTLIHKWFEKFDSMGMAIKCSKDKSKKQYFGKKPEEIVAEWNKTAKESTEFGTKLHEFAEKLLNKEKIEIKDDDELYSPKTSLSSFIEDLEKDYEIISPEFLIFSPSLRLATMIDILAVHKKTKQILIGDWKTYKKLKKKSFFNPTTGEYKVGLGELECVQDCNYQHAALQLNICQEILEKEEYFPPDTKFIKKMFHIKYDGRKKIWKVEPHTIREKKKPIDIMFDKRLAEVDLIKMKEKEEF